MSVRIASSYLFSFVIKMVRRIVLTSCGTGDADICSDRKLIALDYTVEIVLLSKQHDKWKVLRNRLNDGVSMFWMRFGLWRCKMLLEVWTN